jgi:hypothetical protein
VQVFGPFTGKRGARILHGRALFWRDCPEGFSGRDAYDDPVAPDDLGNAGGARGDQCRATSVEEEKARQNKKYRQLAGNIKADHPDAEVEVGVEKPKNLVRRILEGKDKPFKLQVIVIVNDRSRDELDRKLEAVRVAVSRMECQPFQPALVTAALGYF